MGIFRNPQIEEEGAKIMSAAASTVPAQSMKIAKAKEQIGAIVTGIDLAQPIDAATRKELYDAVVENVVLVIRGQAHITQPSCKPPVKCSAS
jgi:ethanolamine utilization protein EutP (predicted NTPase)